jgi:excisionase family DNA binding protein
LLLLSHIDAEFGAPFKSRLKQKLSNMANEMNNGQFMCLFTEQQLIALLRQSEARIIKQLAEKETSKPDEYLTRQETADILKISLPTLSSYTKKGKLKSYRFGDIIRYKRVEVDAALKVLTIPRA